MHAIFVLSLCHKLDPVFSMHVFLSYIIYHETDVMLYCAWSSVSDLGQAHHKSHLLLLLFIKCMP